MPSKPIIPTVSCTSPSPSEGPTMHDFQLALDRRDFSRARDMALAFADPDMRGEHGRCALHFALLYRGSGPVVEALLQKGAQVNCQSSDGTPPLFIAARRNEPALVKKLLLASAFTSLSFFNGEKGEVYGTFKFSEAQMFESTRAMAIPMPKSPQSPPAIINISRSTEVCSFKEGITKEAVAVSPITIRIETEISPLLTAASPIISPPTIETAPPTARGSRIPASLIIS